MNERCGLLMNNLAAFGVRKDTKESSNNVMVTRREQCSFAGLKMLKKSLIINTGNANGDNVAQIE